MQNNSNAFTATQLKWNQIKITRLKLISIYLLWLYTPSQVELF